MRNDRALYVILAVAIAFKVAYFLWGGVEPFQGPDSDSFHSLAVNIAHGEGMHYVDNGAPDMDLRSFRPPLYPFFAGLIFRLTGDNTTDVIILQLVLGVFSLVFLHGAARLLFGETVARWTFLLGALYWTSMYFENQFYTETLFVFLFIVANCLAIDVTLGEVGENERRNWRPVVAGAVYGLAALCRPTAVVALPFVLLWIAVVRRRDGREYLMPVASLAAAAFVVMLPWWIRNYQVHGAFVPFVTSGGLNFRLGNGIPAGSDPMTAAWSVMRNNPMKLGELQLDRWFYRDALAAIKADPAYFLTALKNKFLYYWWPLQQQDWVLPYRYLYPFILLGVGVSLRRFRRAAVLYGIIASQCLLAVLYAAHARYRYPIDFYLLIFAGLGVVGVIGLVPRRRWVGALLAAAILAGGVLFQLYEGQLIFLVKVWLFAPVSLAIAFVGFWLLRPANDAPSSVSR